MKNDDGIFTQMRGENRGVRKDKSPQCNVDEEGDRSDTAQKEYLKKEEEQKQ